MSEHLLPVKTGRESFPVKYRKMHPYSLDWRTALTCEHNKGLYIAVQALRSANTSPSTGTNDGRMYVYYQNLITNDFVDMGVITWEQLQSVQVLWMLVDDDYLYFSVNSGSTILIFSRRALAIVGKFKYDTNAFGAFGKMVWFNKHTIVMAHQAGILFFDTIARTFRYVGRPTGGNFTSSDISVGDKFIMMTSGSSSVNAVLMFRLSDESFSTFSLQTSNVAMCCHDGVRFYIGNTQALYVYNEYSEEMESIVAAPWTNVRSLNYTNSTFFATTKNSNRVYIYGFDFQFVMTTSRPSDWGSTYMDYYILDENHQPIHVPSEGGVIPEWVENTYYQKEYTLQDHRFINMPWSVGDMSASYPLEATTFEGFFFVAKETLCSIDYSGNSKYNFGEKYDVINLVFNQTTKSQFIYDPRFIVFTETYMTLRDGDIRYAFSNYDAGGGLTLKRAVVNKSDYKHFNYAVMKHIENGG